MAGPVETLSFVARRLIQFEQRFERSDPIRKREAAALFTRIAASLYALTADLARDQVPHEPCRDLALYSTRIRECIEEEIGPVEAERLAKVMGEASDKEQLYLQYRSADNKKALSEELEKASILIRALANGLGAGQP
jgi:hypothetical protein